MRLGTWEIIIILVVVLLIFGPGRIIKIAGELGEGIKAFKDGLADGEDSDSELEEDQNSKTEK